MKNLPIKETLTYRSIIKIWSPLAMMWIVMALEMPVVNSVIARMSFPKENLAVFGIVFAISLIIEGPIIQMLSAATALSGTYGNYKKLSHFLFISVIFLTFIHLICIIPPVFNFIAEKLLNLDKNLIRPARISLILMLPWTAAIGYRRMWQGVLIRDGRTTAVTLIMILRISVTFAVLIAGYHFTDLRGSYLASLSLSFGVTAGAAAAWFFASSTVKKRKLAADSENSITWKYLVFFYAPLALTSFVTMANRPLISAGITRGLYPIESLAVWPVIISFLFIFQSFPLSFQEAAITLISDNRESNRKLKNTVTAIGIISAFAFFSVVVIPVIRITYLSGISGLSRDLVELAFVPLLIMTAVTAAAPAISWLRAVNIREGTTVNIALAVMVNLLAIVTSITILNTFFSLPGAVTAALCYTSAIYAEAIFLYFKTGNVRQEI